LNVADAWEVGRGHVVALKAWTANPTGAKGLDSRKGQHFVSYQADVIELLNRTANSATIERLYTRKL
jgi:hypothetical protein